MEPPAAVREVLDAEREWLRAHQQLDLSALDGLMAPDFAQIDAGGRVVGREEVLASFRRGERAWDEAHSDEHSVRLYGEDDDVAVVVGRWRARGTNAGRSFDYASRYVAVWVRRDGAGWRMVSDQATPIEQAF